MPWLERQNSYIDWGSQTVSLVRPVPSCELESARAFAAYTSSFEGRCRPIYATYCSEVALPELLVATNLQTESTAMIPAEYAAYTDVFSEVAANELLWHGPQDHAIDLEPGK